MPGPSLHAGVLDYLDALRAAGASPGTVKQYRSVLMRLVRAYPDRQLGGMTTTDLAQFLYGPKGAAVGRAPATVGSLRAAMNSLFAYAHQQGWIRNPPAVPTTVIRTRKARPMISSMPTRLTPAQLGLMIQRAEDPITRGILAVAINTALRISDVRKIRMQDIDFQTREIYIWIQKTGEFDAFPISLDLEEELQDYLLWYTAETGTTFMHRDHYLFPGWTKTGGVDPVTNAALYRPDPTKNIKYDWAHAKLRRTFELCGIEVAPREAWHVIRRSVARIYFDGLRQEMSHDHALRQTAALLRHKNMETTERYLGMQAEIRARDDSLRGKRFIGVRSDSVVPLRRAGL
jgi:integrase